MEIEIRNFKPDDVGEILEIHSQHKDFFEDFPITREFILEISMRRDFKFFVAEFSGGGKKVVGFCGVLFHPVVGRAEIGPIGVRVEYRNKDVGKKLLDFAEKFLIENGIRRVITKVKFSNKDAIEFFAKLGFLQEGYFKEFTKKKEDVVQLVKFLSPL